MTVTVVVRATEEVVVARTNLPRWERRSWSSAQKANPDNMGAPDLVGRAILRDVITPPSPGAGQRRGPLNETPTIDFEAGTATWTYTLIDKSLSERKADKVAAIKRKAAALVAAGFTYAIPGESPLDPHTYAILDADQANMLAVQVRFSKGGTNHHGGFWRCTSNHNVTMSDAEVQAFFDAAYAYKMGIIRNASVLVDAVRTAANVAALNLIDVDAGTNDSAGGWPTNGGL
ncbi:MAG: hypothetical protein ACMVO3_22620 [Thalassobaculum sp.]